MVEREFIEIISRVREQRKNFCQNKSEMATFWNALKDYDAQTVRKSFQECLEASNFAPNLKDVLLNAKFTGEDLKKKYETIELLATYEAVMQDTPQDFKKWLTYLKPEYIEMLREFGVDLENGKKRNYIPEEG